MNVEGLQSLRFQHVKNKMSPRWTPKYECRYCRYLPTGYIRRKNICGTQLRNKHLEQDEKMRTYVTEVHFLAPTQTNSNV